MASDGRRPGTGKVVFARVQRDGRELPFEDPETELMAALVPGTKVERHHRTWRLGQVTRDEGFVYGRIGFEAEGSGEVWDDDRQDFVEAVAPTGVTSPFALRFSDLRLAFQLRLPAIRHHSFTGAFQALLRASSGSRWRVDLLSRQTTFPEWRRTVDRVTTMRFRLEAPNPHYGDRDQVERLVDGAGAEMVNVVLHADDDDVDGLNIDSEFVRQAVEHAEQYGRVTATGERQTADGQTERAVWDGTGEVNERVVGVDAETGEVGTDDLHDELTTGSSEAEADDHDYGAEGT